MKIIKRKIDNVVIYAGDDLSITSAGVQGDNFIDNQTTTENAVLETVNNLPEFYQGGCFAYDGSWFLTDYGAETLLDVPVNACRGLPEYEINFTAVSTKVKKAELIEISGTILNADGNTLPEGYRDLHAPVVRVCNCSDRIYDSFPVPFTVDADGTFTISFAPPVLGYYTVKQNDINSDPKMKNKVYLKLKTVTTFFVMGN